MQYRTTRCPNCRYVFERHQMVISNEATYFGPEFVTCPKCQAVLRTGVKPYSAMTSAERSKAKSGYVGDRISGGCFGLLIALFGIGGAIAVVASDPSQWRSLFCLVPIGIFGSVAVWGNFGAMSEFDNQEH